MKLLVFIIIILIIVMGLFIVKSNNLDLSEGDDRKELATGMFAWFGKVLGSTADTAKYAAEQEWLPGNNTKTYVVG